jgi:hypothetical protein
MTKILSLLFLLFSVSIVNAQAPTKLCIPTSVGNNCVTIERTFPLPTISQCDSSAVINVSAAATTQLVALTTGQKIRVCSFVISGDTAATVATFVYGTGSNCAGSPANLTGAMRIADEGNISISSNGVLFETIVSNALCLTAVTGAVTGFISYTKY